MPDDIKIVGVTQLDLDYTLDDGNERYAVAFLDSDNTSCHLHIGCYSPGIGSKDMTLCREDMVAIHKLLTKILTDYEPRS